MTGEDTPDFGGGVGYYFGALIRGHFGALVSAFEPKPKKCKFRIKVIFRNKLIRKSNDS